MGLLTHTLKQVCAIITTHTNEFGDLIYTQSDSINCRFREITDLDKQINREGKRSDAMIWFEPTVNVENGTVIYQEGKYYRVQQVIKARRLKGDAVEFIKCMLEAYYLVS